MQFFMITKETRDIKTSDPLAPRSRAFTLNNSYPEHQTTAEQHSRNLALEGILISEIS